MAENGNMVVEEVNIKLIIPHPNNPRTIVDHKFKKLVKSIKEFPEMLQLRPIIVDDNCVVLGGNMRLRACIEAGLKRVPIIKASALTPEQQKRFIITDNVGFGEWNWDILANEWDQDELIDWGLDLPIYKEYGEELPVDNPDEPKDKFVIEVSFETEEQRQMAYKHFIENGLNCYCKK